MAIWPLHLLDVTNTSQFETARNSINLWLATPEEDSMFYRPAASAMNVLLRQNAAAFDNITYLLDHRIEGSTWYREGSQGTCTETPYAGAWAVINWMVQSWNTTTAATVGPFSPAVVVDFFPGVDDVVQLATAYEAAPARVATAQFYRMGTRGGYLASGKRALLVHNSTHFVTRTALVAVEAPAFAASDAVVVVRTSMLRPLAVRGPPGARITELGDGGLVEVAGLAPGETAALFSEGDPPSSFAISPVQGCQRERNFWGMMRLADEGAESAAADWPCLPR